MATAEKAPAGVEESQAYLKGVAKYLLDKLFGPSGPAWGTPFSSLEGTALALGGLVQKQFLDLALARQAAAFAAANGTCPCPSCGRPTNPDDPEPRVLTSRAGEVAWLEPQRYCPRCRKAFFPQSKSLGIDLGPYSTSVLDLTAHAAANQPSFREGSLNLAKYSGLRIHEKQVERVGKRIGAERVAERDAQVDRFAALPLAERCGQAPPGVAGPTPGRVAVVMADAGMLQLRAEPEASTEEAATAPGGAADQGGQEEDDYDQDERPSGHHWHEDKVGLVLTMSAPACQADPCPEVPATFLDPQRVAQIVRGLKKSAPLSADERLGQDDAGEEAGEPDEGQQGQATAEYQGPKLEKRQVVASRRGWPLFGVMLAAAAWQAGFANAQRKAFVADGAKAIWVVWKKRFSGYVPILDFIHALSYVYAAAKAVGADAAQGWQLYASWIDWVWQGKVGRVIEALKEWQREHGKPLKGESKTSARGVVARTLGYLENNRGKMNYATYRRRGLPIVSSLVESMVKQISRRVKGTEKFWTDDGAEAILQLRADYLSDGEVMAHFWQRRQDAATGQRCYRPRP